MSEVNNSSSKKDLKEVWRAIKFVLFSASAGVIEMGVFALLNELLEWRYWPCYLIALTCSVVWNYSWNRVVTFKSRNNIIIGVSLVALYYVFFTIITTLGGDWLVETVGWNEYLVTALNMIFNLVTEYLWQRFVVYHNRVDER